MARPPSRSFVFGLTALVSCAPPPSDPVRAPEGTLSPDTTWRSVLDGRIAAEGRAITARNGVYTATLPAAGVRATFDGAGAVLSGEGGPALSIHTRAWGRADALLSVGAREAALGDCTADRDVSGRCIPRLEYTEPGITEWWTSRDDGLEQGWTLDAAPPGRGPLIVELGVEGALSIDGGDGEASLTDADGRAWTVGELAAWDGNGDPLPAHIAATPFGLRLEVDDAGAVWPVTIDPVYSTAAWAGSTLDTGFGSSVSGAGDVNGDGYDDVIVGVYGYLANQGRADVFLGSADGLSETASTVLVGESEASKFGIAVSGAGDVNGDGYDDVIVGAYEANEACLYLGSASGLSDAVATTLRGDALSSFGRAVASAGDVNGDGYSDVIVGAYEAGSATGRATVYHGSAAGLSESVATTLTGESTGSDFGHAVSPAGDVNGDGFDDVIVGAYGYGSSQGRAYVYLGSASGLSSAIATTLKGSSSKGYFGFDVSTAGDVDGDGYDDVVVGAYGASSYTGQAQIFMGSASGVGPTPATTLVGESTNSFFGISVSNAGDVDSDGYDDVLVDADHYSSSTGRVYVYHGSASGLSSSATTTLTGSDTSTHFGWPVAAAGDVNGDGYDDVFLGSSAKKVWLYEGSASGVVDSAATTMSGSRSTYFGYAVSGAGDVNGDGFDDILVGAFGYASGTGRAYVFLGSFDGPETVAATTLTGEAEGDRFGASLSTAGDVNGDGYADVVIGAYGARDYAGDVYLYLGSASGLSEDAAITLGGASATDYLGYAVSDAGDVNGDGYGDVLIGEYGVGPGTGAATVYYGTTSGLSEADATTLSGETAGDHFGVSVSGAGDVDGDGYDDLVVGANRYGTTFGRVYVFSGSPSGASTTASTTLTGTATGGYFGGAVSGAGDVNADGYGDIVVGRAREDAATVYYGSAAGIASSGSTDLSGPSDSLFGSSVANAGDVNGDGYDDVLVGAPDWYSTFYGVYYVYIGSAAGLGTTPNSGRYGPADYTWFGDCVAGAGDVNGDGYDDVIVGSEADLAYVFLGYNDDLDGDGFESAYDCDDTDAYITPDASEICDGRDNDCDDTTPDCASPDADGDGYGDPAITVDVTGAPSGYVTNQEDCDDTDALSYPGAAEIPGDEIDEDCDGAETCYADADADGAVGGTEIASSDTDCADPGEGVAADAGADCDDADPEISPDATEIPGDEIDEDCDGTEICYVDADGDRYRSDELLVSTDTGCDDGGETSDGSGEGDCDDRNPSVHPGSPERCDGGDADEDCNGLADNDDPAATGTVLYYADADGDGFVDLANTVEACDAPEGYRSATVGDCDDADAACFPGADEIPGDGIDQDCDGTDAVEADTGGDSGTDSGTDTATDSVEDSVTDSGADTVDTAAAGDSAEDTAVKEPAVGCGCASGGDRRGSVLGVLLLLGLATRRRR